MLSWNQLFIRQGWMLEEREVNQFYLGLETTENIDFLMECLNCAKIDYLHFCGVLEIISMPVVEEEWLKIVDVAGRGRTEAIFTPREFLEVERLDVYVGGIVRQLNRLNIKTATSCDGDGTKRSVKIGFRKEDKVNLDLIEQLLGLELPIIRRLDNDPWVHFSLGNRSVLHLNLAEKLSKIDVAWLELGTDYIKQQLFYEELEELLMIPGASGHEGKIRKFVRQKLTPYVDEITVDHYGNLLAEKTFGSGNGPTILLNAHLDVVEELLAGRKIIKDGSIWSSSKGILGADDRAGIAVILEVIKSIKNRNDFTGKIKIIFTVEEEIGLQGAKNVEEHFLWDVDAAIVVDRRGTGDIVTSCGGYIPFCKEEYGQWIEQQAKEAGLTGWAVTPGGSSDTKIWASYGIESVNVSAGYRNEHTEDETLDVEACYQTAKLIKSILKNSRSLSNVLRNISMTV